MDGSYVPTRNPEALEAEVDGERVVMSPADFAYFGLVGTGAEVWDLIDGASSVDALVDLLVDRHGAPRERIATDVGDFLETLEAARLISRS
ncbi:MAG: hypothetical protein RLZZ01_1655 [Actinomycetota bacterium]|jgi:hypothetical protein